MHRIALATDPDGTCARGGGGALFPGVREDSYSHGGRSFYGAVLMLAAVRHAWRGVAGPGLSVAACLRPQLLQPGERLARGEPVRPGMVSTGSQLSGSPCRFEVAQRSLTPWLAGLLGSAVLAHAPIRTPWYRIGARL